MASQVWNFLVLKVCWLLSTDCDLLLLMRHIYLYIWCHGVVSETYTKITYEESSSVLKWSFQVVCFNWTRYEERMHFISFLFFICVCEPHKAEALERSCEIKQEWKEGSRGASTEDRIPPFNLCNLHDSETQIAF